VTIVLLLLLEILRFLRQTHVLFVIEIGFKFVLMSRLSLMICFILTGVRLILSLMWKLPRNYLMMVFFQIVNKHAPFHRFRVKGRDNPWFSSELSCIIHMLNCLSLTVCPKALYLVISYSLYKWFRQKCPKCTTSFLCWWYCICCCASSLTKAFQNLLTAFYTVQHTLCKLKLILNTDKPKLMVFSKA
jgi:hypothetical protein